MRYAIGAFDVAWAQRPHSAFARYLLAATRRLGRVLRAMRPVAEFALLAGALTIGSAALIKLMDAALDGLHR